MARNAATGTTTTRSARAATDHRDEAARLVERMLHRRGGPSQVGLDADDWIRLANRLTVLLGPTSLLAASVRATAGRVALGIADGLLGARKQLVEVLDALRFRPRLEAPAPRGFPSPTPIGDARIVEIPAVRCVRYELERDARSQRRAFAELFGHLGRERLPMRSPVLRDASRGAWSSMAFCYPTRSTGRVGTFGRLRVTDLAEHRAVSLGAHGRMSPDRAELARRRLTAWIDEHAPEWVDGGLPTRVLGWNSPFVPQRSRAWDIQIAIRPREGGGADKEAPRNDADVSGRCHETTVGRIG